jgi:hypothetical protein
MPQHGIVLGQVFGFAGCSYGNESKSDEIVPCARHEVSHLGRGAQLRTVSWARENCRFMFSTPSN